MLTNFLIALVTINTVASQLLIKRAILGIPSPAGFAGMPQFLANAARSPFLYVSLGLQVFGYLLWLVIVSKERIGVAISISGALLYLLAALSAWLLYDEKLTGNQWAGIALITLGVLLVSRQQ